MYINVHNGHKVSIDEHTDYDLGKKNAELGGTLIRRNKPIDIND
jgi:hypothetical protein